MAVRKFIESSTTFTPKGRYRLQISFKVLLKYSFHGITIITKSYSLTQIQIHNRRHREKNFIILLITWKEFSIEKKICCLDNAERAADNSITKITFKCT
jgi:hypothetical protein